MREHTAPALSSVFHLDYNTAPHKVRPLLSFLKCSAHQPLYPIFIIATLEQDHVVGPESVPQEAALPVGKKAKLLPITAADALEAGLPALEYLKLLKQEVSAIEFLAQAGRRTV